VVPKVRGPEISRDIDTIANETEALCADGVTEITLLGQTVNGYGRDLRPKVTFAELLRQLVTIPALRRLSFVTSHPTFVSEDLIETMAALPKISRYLHLPVQSGSDTVLARMKRGYTAAWYRNRVARLRDAIPDLELASDFIVGFCGETDAEHTQSRELIEELRFSQAFVFKYSPRPDTEAFEALADDVPEETKKLRNQDLLAIQERIQLERNRARIGGIEEVLVEGPSKKDPARFTGRTQHHRIVHFPASDSALIGRYMPVRIVTVSPFSMVGELLGEYHGQGEPRSHHATVLQV
jgi:tRNA-2-methylthio-N6-dimethylallyladenosine synthase